MLLTPFIDAHSGLVALTWPVMKKLMQTFWFPLMLHGLIRFDYLMNIFAHNFKLPIVQEKAILKEVSDVLQEQTLDAILCVAGGWAGGNAAHADFVKNSDLMWKQSVWSSALAAALAAKHLKEGGLLTLTGAKAALEGKP
jgi:hypothetical protein